MSFPRNPLPCKLIVGLIHSPHVDLDPIMNTLSRGLGKIEEISSTFPFDQTDFYTREMGMDLKRVFVVFKELFDREYLVEAKLLSFEIEMAEASGGRRIVNIDPGILTLENFVLSTFKNYYHRLYLGKGVYGELTLYYMKKAFRELPWTYPDYRHVSVKRFMEHVRQGLYENTIGKGMRHDTEYDGVRERNQRRG